MFAQASVCDHYWRKAKKAQQEMTTTLTESRVLRYATFTILYVAQGFPFGLVSIALPAYLAEQGADPAAIGSFIAIASLPWTFKLFAGPLMDRWTYLDMGRRRPWVVLAQVSLVLTGLAFAFFPGGLENIVVLTALCLTLNVFAASQDVAVDGMAIDVLPVEEHGRANAFMALGQTAGISGCAVIAAFTVEAYGMPGVSAMLVIGFGLILAVAVAVRERPGEKTLPWTSGQATARSVALKPDGWAVIGVDLARVVLLPASLLMLGVAFIFRFADGIWVAMAPIVVVQELGYDSTAYSSFISAAGFIAAMAGLALGLFIDKKGIRLFYALAMALYGGIAVAVGLIEFSALTVNLLILLGLLQAFIYQGVFISFIASSMNLCWVKVAATQFAIYMAWANLGRSAGAWTFGKLQQSLSYNQIFIFVGIVFFAGVGLIWLTNFTRHREKVESLRADAVGDFAPQR
ncbi:MAG: MFS transporter [Gammaproteobacteria bacterium]